VSMNSISSFMYRCTSDTWEVPDPDHASLVLLRPGVDLYDLLLDRLWALYWPCLRISVRRTPRSSVSWVALSRSDPNCANAASSRVLRQLEAERAGDLLHRLDLRRSTDARHRDASVDGRTLAGR